MEKLNVKEIFIDNGLTIKGSPDGVITGDYTFDNTKFIEVDYDTYDLELTIELFFNGNPDEYAGKYDSKTIIKQQVTNTAEIGLIIESIINKYEK